MNRRVTMHQARGCAVNIAKGRRHRAQAVESSEAGLSRADAASRVGMTEAGLCSLLYREFGTRNWPIAGHEPEGDTPC